MITLIHLLEHLGLPSGAAIAGKKFLKAGSPGPGAGDRDRGQRRSGDYRRAHVPARGRWGHPRARARGWDNRGIRRRQKLAPEPSAT